MQRHVRLILGQPQPVLQTFDLLVPNLGVLLALSGTLLNSAARSPTVRPQFPVHPFLPVRTALNLAHAAMVVTLPDDVIRLFPGRIKQLCRVNRGKAIVPIVAVEFQHIRFEPRRFVHGKDRFMLQQQRLNIVLMRLFDDAVPQIAPFHIVIHLPVPPA